MNGDYLSINTRLLRNIANEISSISERVEKSYQEIDNTVESLTSNGWETEASKMFKKEFESHKNKFRTQLQRLSDSGKTLSNISQKYDKTEDDVIGLM
ncbi:MAG: WXG100 family type VII secretion target [Bacilli bacterium]|nr:WXG100 family type VII secretion target [Bacilli bacterium]